MSSVPQSDEPLGTIVPIENHADNGSFIETLSDGVIFLDHEWRITYANESACRISRIDPTDLNGPSHWTLYPETLGTPLEEVYRRSMEDRVSLDLDFYYPPFDLAVSLRTLPIPTGIAVHYRDISRLKRAEATRDANASQLQQVFDATSDAIVILDRDYTLTFLNRRARELLTPSGDLLGKNLWAAFPSAAYEGSPFVETYHRAMNDGIPGRFEAYYPEPLNIWMSVEAQPADPGIIVFFRDVTRERAIQEELRCKSEEAERQTAEMETVYRTAPIGLALFDAIEFRYLRLNDRQAAFFGLRPEQMVGQTVTEMAPIEGLRELFEQVRDGRPVVNYPLEGELVSHPGQHRYWTVNYAAVRGPDGKVQAIAAATLEITAQKRTEKALIQSEKLAAVGRLASSISHEINNPLESITNLLYLIDTDPGLPAGLKPYVDLTQAEVARVSQIATQTLRFHRQSTRPTSITTTQLLSSVLSLYQGRFANCGISISTRFASDTPILCLENEIRQVLSNLVANAIDAMRTGGRLSVRAHAATNPKTGLKGVRMVVADSGEGMSAETMVRVFEPFFTTKDLNGTGLGLWISEEIVQRHGGRLSVRSSQDAARHGTVFSLFLPLQSCVILQRD